MIRIILYAILLLTLPIRAWSTEEIEGQFGCEVKYQNYLIFEEAKALEYKSYGDEQIQVGEFVEIIYKYDKQPNLRDIHVLEISIKSAPERDNDYLIFFGIGSDKFFPQKIDSFIARQIHFEAIGGSASFWLGEDRMGYYGTSEIDFKRYYKNDWSVLLNYSSQGTVWTIGLDCRHNTDKIAEIIADYKIKGYMDDIKD